MLGEPGPRVDEENAVDDAAGEGATVEDAWDDGVGLLWNRAFTSIFRFGFAAGAGLSVDALAVIEDDAAVLAAEAFVAGSASIDPNDLTFMFCEIVGPFAGEVERDGSESPIDPKLSEVPVKKGPVMQHESGTGI